MQAHHQIFKAICKAALVSFCVYKESIPACTWYLPVFQSLNAEKSKTKKRNHDTEPADFVKLFLNTYSGKPAQEGSKTRSARSAGRSPFPHGPKGSRQPLGLQEMIFGFPHGLIKVGQPTTPGQGRVCREPPAQRPFPKAGEGRAAAAQLPQPCVLQQTLSGGREGGRRGLEPLDPRSLARSGKPDARPGTDASSRAIFTNQWMRRRSRSWNWSCCSSPSSLCSAGLEGSGRLWGPSTEFRHRSHSRSFSAHTTSKSEFPIRIHRKIQ